jgi:signal transduction histidine kinase
MLDTFMPEPVAAWLSPQLQDARDELASKWRSMFPSRELYIADLIGAIAENLRLPHHLAIASNASIMHKAAEFGRLRFAQGSTVHQLLREYQALADLLEDFLLDQVRRAEQPFASDDLMQAMRRVTQSVRALQQQTVEAFVERYTDTIQRQREQLVAFGRLVAHEMRQPLGVLQLMSGVVPIREGDHELTHLLDVFDRNIRGLARVAAELERLSHDGLDSMLTANEHATDLGALVADVAEKLREMALAHDVRVQLDSELPVLRVDPARTEMIFVSLIANAIKYSDPAKPARLVEVLSARGQPQPTVIVRDNGIGMPRQRVQHFFREFARAHAHRDRDQRDQGLGLGLSIVRDSMDAIGGTVLLQSTEGVGTTVTLSWPVRATPAAR